MNPFTNARIIQIGADPEEYHAKPFNRGDKRFVMTRSELTTFARNPQGWLRGYEDEETRSTEFGSLVDCIALTPDQFFARFAIAPETYTNKKGEQSAWRNDKRVAEVAEWLEENEGKTIVKRDVNAGAHAAVERLKGDERIAALLACSDTQVFVTGEYHDQDTGLVINVKALLDLVPKVGSPYQKCLGDLKTARNAAPGAWARVCFEQGYGIQAAFYSDLYVAATNEDRTDWLHIIVENEPPYEVARRLISAEFVQYGRDQYFAALRAYCQCLSRNFWPGYDDVGETWNGWRWVQPEPWMVTRTLGCELDITPEPKEEKKPNLDAPMGPS